MADQLYEASALEASDMEDAPAIIPGVVSREDKIICVAAPKVGKSILSMQLARCLAGGQPFLGHTPVPGTHRVLYVSAEGSPYELRDRGKRMGLAIPIVEDRLWYWPTPTYPLNTSMGVALMLEHVREVRPDVIIADPIYALMSGSMRDDEKAGDFVRAINRVQQASGAAVVLIHHTHRPVKDKDGDNLNEDDEAYFGSMIWAAWPRSLWLMRKDGQTRHSVMLTCGTNRDGTNAVEKVGLMLSEPRPLLFVPRGDKRMGPTCVTLQEALRVEPGLTQAQLTTQTGRPVSTVSEGLTQLEGLGLVRRSGGRPETWESTGA